MLLDSAEILLLSIREKRHAEIIECLGKLDDLSLQEVYNELKSDQEKTVFWVNIYNALFQLMAAEFSEQLTLDRRTFFTEKRIPLLECTSVLIRSNTHFCANQNGNTALVFGPTLFGRK